MKKATSSLAPVSAALDVREWHGQPIQRRRVDGYVNATAMCKANGKLWGNYRQNERCQAYASALSETIGIPMVSLIETREGRNGGTWVHPQIAVDLARWISAPFAVWMDGWFLESSTTAKTANKKPASYKKKDNPANLHILPPQEVNDDLMAAVCYLPSLLNERRKGANVTNSLFIKQIAQKLMNLVDPGISDGDLVKYLFYNGIDSSKLCDKEAAIAERYKLRVSITAKP